jgi:hypothetical protein
VTDDGVGSDWLAFSQDRDRLTELDHTFRLPAVDVRERLSEFDPRLRPIENPNNS